MKKEVVMRKWDSNNLKWFGGDSIAIIAMLVFAYYSSDKLTIFILGMLSAILLCFDMILLGDAYRDYEVKVIKEVKP